MRAARFYKARDIRIEEIPTPEQKSNDVLISVEWCGICGTDLHEYQAGPMYTPAEGHPHRLTGCTVPITMGHEFCGRVLKAPSDSDLKPGQPVMVDPRLYCASCTKCKEEVTNACQAWGFLGLDGGGGGGLSETVAVDRRMCYPLPESVDLRFAALMEPLAVARHAVRTSNIMDFRNRSVLIIGGGPIGFALGVMLRAEKPAKLFVSEPAVQRQQLLLDIVDEVFNPLGTKVAERCRSLTDGKGVDVVFDCAGVQAGLQDGTDALTFGGLYVNVAAWEETLLVNPLHLLMKEIKITGSMAYDDRDFAKVVKDFSNGVYKGIEKMVSSRVILEDVVEKGFEKLVTDKDSYVKILITPKTELLT